MMKLEWNNVVQLVRRMANPNNVVVLDALYRMDTMVHIRMSV